jgi:hypothetical protein
VSHQRKETSSGLPSSHCRRSLLLLVQHIPVNCKDMGPPTSSATAYRYDQKKKPPSSRAGRIAAPPAAVLEPTPHDVLIVRGKRGLNTPGNVLFRHLIKARAVDYQATDRSPVRDSIASEIMAEIAKNGGRFLQLPNIPNGEDAGGGSGDGAESSSWVVIRKNVARAKVKQALRDTIKASAAAAHQRHYSKQQQRHRQQAVAARHQSLIRDAFDSSPAPSSLFKTMPWQSPPNNHTDHNLALRNGSRSSTAPGNHAWPLDSPTVLTRGSPCSSSCTTTGVLPSVEQAAAKALVQAVGSTHYVPAAAAAAAASSSYHKARTVAEMLFSPRNRATTARASPHAQQPHPRPMMIPHELVLADHQSVVASTCLPAVVVCIPPAPAPDPVWNDLPQQWPAIVLPPS